MSWEIETGSSGGEWEAAPAGNHPAVLVALVDVGSQLVRGFQGGPDSWKRQVVLVWEIPGEKDSRGKPFVIGRPFTRSLHEKAALRDWIERWRGKKYNTGEKINLSMLVGQACMLTVIHDENGDRVFARPDGIAGVPRLMPMPKATHNLILWQIGDGTPPPADEWLPLIFGKRIINMIEASPEFHGKEAPAQPSTKPSGNGSPAKPSPASQPQATTSDGGVPF